MTDILVRSKRLLVVVAVVTLTLHSRRGVAHDLGMSGVRVLLLRDRAPVALDLDAVAVADVLARELDLDHDGRVAREELEASRGAVQSYLESHLELRADGTACDAGAIDGASVTESRRLRVRLGYRCRSSMHRLVVTSRLLVEHSGGHRLTAEVLVGTRTTTRLLSNAEPSLEVDAGGALERDPAGEAWLDGKPAPAQSEASTVPTPQRVTSTGSFVGAGIRHVLSGPDHVLFVLALVFSARRLVELVKLVTMFTLAHSLTLLLSVLGAVSAGARWVESAIALSIVWMWLEVRRRGTARQGALVTFGFGLVHGLGFASAIGELGLSGAAALLPVLGFNLGVELGQLAIVVPTFVLVMRARGRPALLTRGRNALATFAIVLGAVWLFERLFDVSLLPG